MNIISLTRSVYYTHVAMQFFFFFLPIRHCQVIYNTCFKREKTPFFIDTVFKRFICIDTCFKREKQTFVFYIQSSKDSCYVPSVIVNKKQKYSHNCA